MQASPLLALSLLLVVYHDRQPFFLFIHFEFSCNLKSDFSKGYFPIHKCQTVLVVVSSCKYMIYDKHQ